MLLVLPFDVIDLIVDIIVKENKDTRILKKLALVSHSFLHICRKYLFATVELHDANLIYHASSKKGFVKLLKRSPNVVNYIRNLTYEIEFSHFQSSQFSTTHPSFDNDDDLLSSTLPNFLRTIPCLNYLKIRASTLDWNKLNPSLILAFLHLMHLPSINHIDLSSIKNFPLSSLTPSVNLLRLDISRLRYLNPPEEDYSFEIVLSEAMPNIREFHSSESSLLTTKLLHAKTQDGQPAFNFMDLRRLSMSLTSYDAPNLRYLLQNAKLLEKLRLSVGHGQSLVGLLSPIACTLKVLDLTVLLSQFLVPPLAGLCEELEKMAGHTNKLEALSPEVLVGLYDAEDFIGSIIQNVEKVLLVIKPGWSALRAVSFKVTCMSMDTPVRYRDLARALQYLPERYLRHLSKLESVAFNYSVNVD